MSPASTDGSRTHAHTYGVLGAIVGDVIGSRYEFSPIKTVEFELFPDGARYTDDTVCTLAMADAFMELARGETADRKLVVAARLRSLCRMHPDGGYGGNFASWLSSDSLEPYGSYGNGAAMRVSPAAAMADDGEGVVEWAELSSVVTHDHPEGINGAQATAWAIFQAADGMDQNDIRAGLADRFGYDLRRSVDEIREVAVFDETCPVSVPEAFTCFLESTDFESAVRNAVSLGADADTQAAIAGSIAECFYGGVPEDLAELALATLTPDLHAIFDRWTAFLHRRAGDDI